MQPFEQATDTIDKHPVAATLTREFPGFVAGQKDAVTRIQSLELAAVKHAESMTNAQKEIADLKQQINTLASDRTDMQKRQDAVEAAPAEHAKRMTLLEKTVSMLHGAVASLGHDRDGTQDPFAERAQPVAAYTPPKDDPPYRSSPAESAPHQADTHSPGKNASSSPDHGQPILKDEDKAKGKKQ